MNIFRKYKMECCRVLYYIIDIFIPKTKKIIIIGSSNGRHLNGNGLKLYKALEKIKGYKVFYFSYRKFENEIKVVNELSLKGLYYIFRSKIFIMTHGPRDFGNLWNSFYKNRYLIQTWHGLPFKTVGILNFALNKVWLKRALRISKKYTHFITTSNFVSMIYASSYNINLKKFYPIGYPRNDLLFLKQSKSDLFKKYGYDINDTDFTILYAPTFREWENTKIFPFQNFDFKDFTNFLKNNNVKLFLRLHLFDGKFKQKDEKNILLIENIKNNKYIENNILNFDSKIEPEINKALNCFDLLITDYSSIFIDYLLLDRPIIFLPYDLNKYEKKHGFFFDYNTYTPGPKIYSYEKFKKYILNVKMGIDNYKKNREIIRNLIYKYKDDKSTERFLKEILNIKL